MEVTFVSERTNPSSDQKRAEKQLIQAQFFVTGCFSLGTFLCTCLTPVATPLPVPMQRTWQKCMPGRTGFPHLMTTYIMVPLKAIIKL